MGINMKKKYARHNDKFKLKVALAAIKGNKTVLELCQEFHLLSNQIYAWKKQLEEHGEQVFSKRKSKNRDTDIEHLHATIGKLKVENDFLERVLGR